jgi:hypothetical protein
MMMFIINIQVCINSYHTTRLSPTICSGHFSRAPEDHTPAKGGIENKTAEENAITKQERKREITRQYPSTKILSAMQSMQPR